MERFKSLLWSLLAAGEPIRRCRCGETAQAAMAAMAMAAMGTG